WLRFPAFSAHQKWRLKMADRCPCSASAVSSAGCASAAQSLGTKFAAEPCTRPGGLAHSQRQISLYVSRPSAHVGWTGLLLRKNAPASGSGCGGVAVLGMLLGGFGIGQQLCNGA